MIEITPDAMDDIRETWLWYEDRDAALSAAFEREVDHAMEQIALSPERWPTHLYGTRRYLLKVFPYQIIYRVYPASVVIYAVAHHRRRPGFWKNRLP